MEKDIDVQLTQKALRIKEIENLSIRALVEGKLEELGSLLDEYIVLKKVLRNFYVRSRHFRLLIKLPGR